MTDPAELVRALYEGCNAGDAAAVTAVLTDGFRYYSLGAVPLPREQLAGNAAIAAEAGTRWSVERIIVQGDEAAVEFTMRFLTADGSTAVQRGSEWVQTVDEGGVRRIDQIRSYHQDSPASSALVGFDYAAAGYSTHRGEASDLHTPRPNAGKESR